MQIMTSISKISLFVLCTIWLSFSLVSCLGGNEAETINTNYQNSTITSFSVSDNSDVCANLSSYTFTIDNFGTSDPDLVKGFNNAGIIFNPDSLPVGTVPDSINISLSYGGTPSSIYIRQYDLSGNLENTINFSDTTFVDLDTYPDSRIDITSYDKSWTKTYFIKLNIHTVYGDTIRWRYNAKDVLDKTNLTDQQVGSIGSTLYWFAEYGDALKVSTADKDQVKKWSDPMVVSASELPVLSTLYCLDDTFYAVGKNGSLLSSTDGTDWSVASSAATFVSILGRQYGTKNYDEHLHAIVNDGGTYKFALSYDLSSWEIGEEIPDGFPIKGFSTPISVKAKPSAGNMTSRIYIVGGEKADGTYCNSTWSCDGTTWAEFEQNILPCMVRSSIIEYTLDIDAPQTFWILWPGVKEDGSVSNTVYFSENKGVTWKYLVREFESYATTSPIAPVGGVSSIMNNDNYWMYFFGGVDADGNQKTDIFGGQLQTLTFDKLR